MSRHFNSLRLAFMAATFVAGFSAAWAQDAATPQPTTSTESYDAWSIECTAVRVPAVAADAAKKVAAAPETTARICEVAQVYKNQKTGNEVARVAFAYDPKNKGKLVGGIRTLVDVSFDKPTQLLDGNKELAKGNFRRCVGTNCFAILDVADDKLALIAKASALSLQFPISDGKLLRIKMSPVGLNNAMRALKARTK
jgi:invasion protein IalB